MEECCVCFEPTENMAMPCGHSICETCAFLCLNETPKCPTCRQVIVKLSHSTHEPRQIKVLHPVTTGKIGITISAHSKGVVVSKVTKKSQTHFSGLRQGDIITHMNGIPQKKPVYAIALINRARDLQVPVACTILKEDSFIKKLKTMFYAKFLIDSKH